MTSTQSPSPRAAPPGFSDELWKKFDHDGFCILPNALPPNLTADLQKLLAGFAKSRSVTDGFDQRHIVEAHPLFTRLIAHDSFIGYIYDVYGESTKLLLSQFFVRPPRQQVRNDWHFDGPRQVPFQVFSPKLPLRIKVGIWLTDLLDSSMGNLIFVPGSHRQPHFDLYKTHERHPSEVALRVQAGSITLMSSGLWHRVDENTSDRTRLNIFMEYGPSWLAASDRWRCNLSWLSGLGREERIIMRDYDYPNSLIKPPEADTPLFLDRDGETSPDMYRDHVPPNLRKRPTWIEKRGYL